MPDTNALVLEIIRQDRQLAMSACEQKESALTLKHYSQSAVSFLEIDRLCQEVTSVLNKIAKLGNQEHDLTQDLRKLGQLLWDQLLTKSVKDRLKTAQVADLILSIDEELINIPWELLHDGQNFLCLKFNLGRLVRTKHKAQQPEYRNVISKPKMLILANPTADLDSAYHEGVYIKNQFDKKRNQIAMDFKSTHIDTLYVKKNLRDYDIVHFAGHCEYDADNPKNSGWVLLDGRFTTQDILLMGESLSLPTLVFSNACQSAQVTKELMDIDYQEKTYSLASAFLFAGVRHYIGTIRKIEDPVSLTFAKEFYTQLISGKSVGECVRLSRLRLSKEYGVTSIWWSSYLLYGDPNFVLFKTRARASIAKSKRKIFVNKKIIIRSVLIILLLSLCLSLYLWLPTINPNTYISFLRSNKHYLSGNNQETISLCSRIIKKDPLFLATYPLLADTYQRLGDRENALKYYFDYALMSEKKHDLRNLASAYIGIGWIYQLQGEYPKAFDFYHKAITLSRENKDSLNEAIGLRKLAVWYIDREDYDKALELIMKSSEINRERQYIREHRYNLACDFFDIGLIFSNKDDFVAAKEFYTKSRLLFEKLKLKKELSDYYFNLGEICMFEKQYQKALDCYMKGLKIDQSQGNMPNIATDYNMVGELYVEMDNLPEAQESFSKAVSVASKINAQPELADAYYNLGLLHKQKNQKNKAREYLKQAQEIYRKIDSPEYQKIKQEFLELN
jgi:tetratricopeptide (TPR) repeat protein